jgi:hypothetical protein
MYFLSISVLPSATRSTVTNIDAPIPKAKPEVGFLDSFFMLLFADPRREQGESHGQYYFFCCSGWTPKFKENHRTHSIPDQVDVNLLVKLRADQRLWENDNKDEKPCGCLVHSSTALKQRNCRAIHCFYF